MITVVCVFNDREMVETRLLSSLRKQSVPCDLILLDNTQGQYESATSALNMAARDAKGDWIMFAHQDICLLTSDWLERAEPLFEQSSQAGWIGVAGCTGSGYFAGIVRDAGALLGAFFAEPSEVQTLDECLLVHRRIDGKPYFDPGISGWHAYGVEACCTAIRNGMRNYAIHLPVWHDSRRVNWAGLESGHRFVWDKHQDAFAEISTTCGILPWKYRWRPIKPQNLIRRASRRISNSVWRLRGFRNAFARSTDTVLERLTSNESYVACLHGAAWFDRIEAAGFTAHPKPPRTIVHEFTGLEGLGTAGKCVVLAPDVLKNSQTLPHGSGDIERLILWADFEDLLKNRTFFEEIRKRATFLELTSGPFAQRALVAEIR